VRIALNSCEFSQVSVLKFSEFRVGLVMNMLNFRFTFISIDKAVLHFQFGKSFIEITKTFLHNVILWGSERRPDSRDPSLIQVFIFPTSVHVIRIVVLVVCYMLILGSLDTVHCLS
jgi:hypothetical protein